MAFPVLAILSSVLSTTSQPHPLPNWPTAAAWNISLNFSRLPCCPLLGYAGSREERGRGCSGTVSGIQPSAQYGVRFRKTSCIPGSRPAVWPLSCRVRSPTVVFAAQRAGGDLPEGQANAPSRSRYSEGSRSDLIDRVV